MKWFWYSLIVFCLLMCSCKTQKLDSNVKTKTEVNSALAYLNTNVKTDTTRTTWVEQLKESKVIKEKTTITEYDKDTGNPTKKTETEREIAQDTDKVVAEEENQAVTYCNQLEVEHFREDTKKVESEVKEESIGGQESFGKYFGIVLAVVIGLFLLYLLRKLRIY